MSDEKQTFDAWAVVDLFGHTRIVGRVSEQVIGGCAFVRVDVPDVSGVKGYTRLLGQGAIYSITITTEEVARAMAENIRARPIQAYELPRLPNAASDDDPPC